MYGIGVCAAFGGSVFRPLVGGSFIDTDLFLHVYMVLVELV